MNTTDTALKEMYDAFALCKTNKSKVKFLEDHKESGLYKDCLLYTSDAADE